MSVFIGNFGGISSSIQSHTTTSDAPKSITYSTSGDIVSISYGNGQIKELLYDSSGRVVVVQTTKNGIVTSAQISYNQNGQVVAVSK